MLNLIWADRDSLPASDRGLAYGDGLFETIRVQGRRAVLLQRHLARMAEDAARLGISVSASDLAMVVARAVDRYVGSRSGQAGAGTGKDVWVLKLILTRGSGGRGYRPAAVTRPNLIVSFHAMPPVPDPSGVMVKLSDFPLTINPRLAGIKSLNRLEQVMASRELTDEEYEVIMTDSAGSLVEGTRTNLLLRYRGQWLTPPVSSLAVAGVMRAEVLDALRAAGERVRERLISPSMLSEPDCKGLYLMNSVVGVVSVRRVGCVDLPLDDGLATICPPLETLE